MAKLDKEVAKVKRAIRMLQDAQLEIYEASASLQSMGYKESAQMAEAVFTKVESAESAAVDLWRKLQ